MFLSYERSLQPDLVGADIIVPIAGLVGGRDPGPSASDYLPENLPPPFHTENIAKFFADNPSGYLSELKQPFRSAVYNSSNFFCDPSRYRA
jgi:hypothetical protein